MNTPDKFNSTDIAQICRDGDGRFDELRTGKMVEGRKPSLADWKLALLVVPCAFTVVVIVAAVLARIAG